MDVKERIGLNMKKFAKNGDLLLVAGVIGILFIILKPLPPILMDGLLVFNLLIAMLILMTTIYVSKPLDFSAFPSVLLGVTMFRLALNIATTRLVFANAITLKSEAAGKVIEAFGLFIAGDDPVIGIILFVIIVVIQFVVVTKGATRISEVAARFTLDAMPGKQMAIDADLNAGLINEEDARKRRKEINQEADFYGAMDGASKFVRGDAIAGIIITLINIIGGFIFGTVRGMDLSESAKTFTLLTIGDGLVSQIPGLIVSISAGLIVTRTTSESNLGKDVSRQIFSDPKVMAIGAGFLGVLLITPLPKMPLLVLGISVFMISRLLDKAKVQQQTKTMEQAKRKEIPKGPEDVTGLLTVDPMELEVGYGLIRLVDATQGGDLLEKIQMIRRQVAVDFGLVVPPIRIRDNMQLPPQGYRIKIRGARMAEGTVVPDRFMAMDSGIASGPIEGEKTREPAFGLTAYWIDPKQKQRAEAMGYTVVDPSSVLATHLTEVIKSHAYEILTREDVHSLIENAKKTHPKLVAEVVPEALKISDLHKILQTLLVERVSIRNLPVILETIGNYVSRTKDPAILTEYVRNGLAREICLAHMERDGKLYVITLDPEIEDMINASVTATETGTFLSMSPQQVRLVTEALSRALEKLLTAGHHPIVLTSPQIRPHVKRIADRIQNNIVVMSYNEIVKDAQVEAVAMAAAQAQGATK